jgi:hypothetical protein
MLLVIILRYLIILVFKIHFYHLPGALDEGKPSSPNCNISEPQAAVSTTQQYTTLQSF